MNKPTVYIDLDETLVWSRSNVPGSVKVISAISTGFTIARPSAKEFLEILKPDYRLASITTGIVEWQKDVLEKLGLLHYFEEINGWLDLDRTKHSVFERPEKWLLVDNYPPHSMNLMDKLQWLGIDEFKPHNFVKAEDFEGRGDPAPLTLLIPEIREKLK